MELEYIKQLIAVAKEQGVSQLRVGIKDSFIDLSFPASPSPAVVAQPSAQAAPQPLPPQTQLDSDSPLPSGPSEEDMLLWSSTAPDEPDLA